MNYHRPCLFPVDQIDPKGRIKKRYPDHDVTTPYEKLKSLPHAARYLKPQLTFAKLDALAYATSDLDAAQAVNDAPPSTVPCRVTLRPRPARRQRPNPGPSPRPSLAQPGPKRLPRLERRRLRGSDGNALPVRGFRPVRAARLLVANVPNPATVTLSPLARASPTASKTALTAVSAAAFDSGAWRVTWAAMSDFFIVLLLPGFIGGGAPGSRPRPVPDLHPDNKRSAARHASQTSHSVMSGSSTVNAFANHVSARLTTAVPFPAALSDSRRACGRPQRVLRT